MPDLGALQVKADHEDNLNDIFHKKNGFLKKFLMSLPSTSSSSSPTTPLSQNPPAEMPPTPPDSAASSEDDIQIHSKSLSQVDLIPTNDSMALHSRLNGSAGSEVTKAAAEQEKEEKSANASARDDCGRTRGSGQGVLIEVKREDEEDLNSRPATRREIASSSSSSSLPESSSPSSPPPPSSPTEVALSWDDEAQQQQSSRHRPGTPAAAQSGGRDSSSISGLARSREASRLSAPSQDAKHGVSGATFSANAIEKSETKINSSAALCVMQQKIGAPTAGLQSGEISGPHGPMVPMGTLSGLPVPTAAGGGGGVPRSILKRSAGQRSWGNRVRFNEEKNEVVEADYVILLHDEDEPQLVSVKAFDLGLNPGGSTPCIDGVTLSPPEGYKDCFGRAVRETIVDETDAEPGLEGSTEWKIEFHDPDCPRANLPDLVSTGRRSPQLTVENVRHHDQLMQDHREDPAETSKVAKTGILKGGKLWKNGEKFRPVVHVDKVEEPRRSVRFSGQDEYTTLEAAAALDKIPFDTSNGAKLAYLLSPQFQELILRESGQDGWPLDLSPIGIDEIDIDFSETIKNGEDFFRQPCPKHNKIQQHFNDEHISESVQRYDEMRRKIAIAEGRDNNSTCSDESKSSSDSQSSDSAMTETRIRRLENADVAQVAGGIIRSNSEVRRAIERNALRRSLMRFAEARKKDTNRNEKSDKQETSLIEKLKWLTASEDATNANSNDEQEEEDDAEPEPERETKREEDIKKPGQPPTTIEQYRKLASMFNKTTSLRPGDISVPKDVREWKLNAALFADMEGEEVPSGSITYTAIPVVSICEQLSDEECEKLIYSGGVRYTKEGTLPRKLHGGSSNKSTPDIQVHEDDEAIHDDRSSSVPSSSQSSPRLSGRSDVDGASTAESGYSSNETNSDLSQILHPEFDELVEFVKQDAGRINRLRRKYDESEDHGFNRRPSVRGIRVRFGSTSDILSQIASQLGPPQMGTHLIPPPMVQPTIAGSHLSWPCRELSESETSTMMPRKKVSSTRSNTLPSLQEDTPFTQSNCSSLPIVPPPLCTKNARLNTSYSSTDSEKEQNVKASANRESSTSDIGKVPTHLPAQRAQSLSSLNQTLPSISSQPPCARHSIAPRPPHLEYHHPSCSARRPASVHGHAPTDMLVSGPQHPTPQTQPPDAFSQHPPPPRQFLYSSLDDSRQDDGMMLGSRVLYDQGGSGSCHPLYTSQSMVGETKHFVDHHNNFPTNSAIHTHGDPSEINPSHPREFHGSNCSSLSSSQMRIPKDVPYQDSFCSGWHSQGSVSSYHHVHRETHDLPPPIVSSHMSYTMPIVPEDKSTRPTALFNGLVSLDNNGSSITNRGTVETYPIHTSPTRETSLHIRHSQTMNVST